MRRGSIWFGCAAALLALQACSHGGAAVTARQPTRPTVTPPQPAGSDQPHCPLPLTIRAQLIPHNYVRLPVPSADISNLVRVRGETIAALVDGGAFAGEVYPVISNDDGGDWRIDGPRFSGGGASGPTLTNRMTVTDDGTVVAWGDGGNLVRARTFDAVHWYDAAFSVPLREVSASGRRLTAVTDRVSQAGSRCRFVSRDNGRSWHRAVTTS